MTTSTTVPITTNLNSRSQSETPGDYSAQSEKAAALAGFYAAGMTTSTTVPITANLNSRSQSETAGYYTALSGIAAALAGMAAGIDAGGGCNV